MAALVGVVLVGSAVPAAVAEPARAAAGSSVVEVSPGERFQAIDGWGTSLAWWAEGGDPNGRGRTEVADRLFSPTDGLGLNAVRYNFGAVTPKSTCGNHWRAGGGAASFETGPGTYDWSQDANQRWMLQAAKQRGASMFEGAAYSAPDWMTRNGCAAGASPADHTKPVVDNLNPKRYDDYARYLATVDRHFHDQWGITFDTVEPFNESRETHWGDKAGAQEGMNLDLPVHNTIVDKLAGQLPSYSRPAAPDELTPSGAANDVGSYSAANQKRLAHLSTHDYTKPADGASFYQLGQRLGKPLWMSEWGDNGAWDNKKHPVGGNPCPTDAEHGKVQLQSGIELSQRILANEQVMHPSVWTIWQAVDGGPAGAGNADDLWGLICAPDITDYSKGKLTYPKRYSVLGQYSKFVRPGQRMIGNSDPNTFTAYDPAKKSLVIVATNPGSSDAKRTFDLSGFSSTGRSAAAWRTDASHNLSTVPATGVARGAFSATLPKKSVTTYVVPGVSYSGTTITGRPAAVQYGQQMQVFGRTTGGTTASNVYTDGLDWSGWQNLGGTAAGSPAAVRFGRQMWVFGRTGSGSGNLYADVYTPGSGWSYWQNLGGSVGGDPAAVTTGQRLQVFGRGPDGSVRTRAYDGRSRKWSDWQNLGGHLTGDPAAMTFGSQVQVFGRGTDGEVYSRVYTDGKGWAGWQNLGGQVTGDPTAIQFGQQVQVFGRGTDGNAYSRVYTEGKGWTGWQNLGGHLTGDPTAVQFGRKVFVFGRAGGNAVHADSYDEATGKWSGWHSLGGSVSGDPTAVTYGQQVQVFARDGGAVSSDVFDQSTGRWSGWRKLGGH